MHWKISVLHSGEEQVSVFKKMDISATNLATTMQQMTANENVNSDNISEWFVVNCAKLGHKQLSNSEFFRYTQGQSRERDENFPPIPEKWNSLPKKQILFPPKDKAVSMVITLLLT